MYVTGSSKNIQYKKPDHSFYRGIVIDDQDPNKLMRVKVFIPELSNQPYEGWLDDYNNGIQTLIQPGAIGPLLKENVDTLKELIPWAEQMAPLMGESGTSHYFASKGEQRSKATYVETSTQSTPPAAQKGGTMPRVMLTNPGPQGPGPVGAWWQGGAGGLGKTNPYGNQFAPKNSGPESSGVYGVPQVGAHVWVFHYRGDLNYPVYFGTSSSYRDTALVYGKGESYPGPYSSNTGDSPPEPGRDADSLDPRWDELKRIAKDVYGAKFRQTSGYRSQAEQNEIYASGRTKAGPIRTQTLNSKHTQGLAIDVVWTGGENRIAKKGEDPTGTLYDPIELENIARIFQQAGRDLGISVTWGGDWKSFQDRPHLQIPAA